jgi:hypothetical protein
MIKKFSKRFLLLAFVMFLASCASSPIKLSETDEIATDERIVFGRVKVMRGEEAINWEWKPLFGPGQFEISILPDGSSEAIYYRLSDDGSFYWHLPPGGYSIAGYHWQFSEGMSSGNRIFADFIVPGERTATYIGTLVIAGGLISIEDEYEEAINAFNSKFEEFREPITKNLMRLEKRR